MMRRLLLFIVCALTTIGVGAATNEQPENGTSGSFFLYESGTPATNNVGANTGYQALIGAETYQSGKKWTQIEQSEAGSNVSYQNDPNWITNNANNGSVGDEVAVPNGEYEYQYYIKEVTENGTAGTWTGPLTTAPEGVDSFTDIEQNQIDQKKNEGFPSGTYYFRVSVPLYDFYRKVRCWVPTTLDGNHTITYYEAGTDVNTIDPPTNDEGKLAIGGDYWYVENGQWVAEGAADNKWTGEFTSDDIATINATEDGPRVLDLSGIDSPTTSEGLKALLDNLTNTNIEYIILPAGMTGSVVGDYPALTNLKCVISTDDSSKEGDKALNAYVKVAGSLAEARYHATGGSIINGAYQPNAQGLTSVKLSGNLNAADIMAKESNLGGLDGENLNIQTLDLEDAYFATVTDMKLGQYGAGFDDNRAVLSEVILPSDRNKSPNDPKMTVIPAQCLYGIHSLTHLHIPYNYETIEWEAFWETEIGHITTEDASHALIDNGPKTWTLSANIKTLGEPGKNSASGSAVFPQNVMVTDVYCLAVEPPVCYGHTFHDDAVYGQGGPRDDGVYCRDKYIKQNNVIAVLHYPSQESYIAATGDTTKVGYQAMVEKYTDPTRVYSKKDQTGAVDANGNPLLWPDQGELKDTRQMAWDGLTWNDYDKQYQVGGTAHLISMQAKSDAQQKDFYPNYIGWHEFVLTVATYVEPDEIVEEEKIIRDYVQTDWYTFCIPFDMTVSQVQEMLGVPASTDKVTCRIVDANGTVTNENVTSAIMPDIRQLSRVTRKKGEGSANNEVRLYLTENLWDGTNAWYLDFNPSADNNGQHREPSATSEFGTADDPRCLLGGRPYVIKAYRRAGDANKIKKQNLGLYVMTRYGDAFNEKASCVSRGLYEQLKSGVSGNDDLETLRFAIPYENHKVRALKNSSNATYLTYTNDGTAYHYNYTMVGQFWQQPLPLYCFYMSKGHWYRFADNTGNYSSYTWDPYKCIIMATPEIDDTAEHPMSGKYRDDVKSHYPVAEEGTHDLLKSNFKLEFLDGRDDDDFNNEGTWANQYVFYFDDGITEYDEDGNEVTAIDMIDGESMTVMPANGKVYNMSGQLVGSSTDNLTKGMYIVNGKKLIVK